MNKLLAEREERNREARRLLAEAGYDLSGDEVTYKKVTIVEGIAHGTTASYWSRGCRCDDCRRANRDYQRTHPGKDKDHDKHGTVTGYCYYACRCDDCREAQRVSVRKYREKLA